MIAVRRTALVVAAILAVVPAAAPASAGWWEVARADASFDLPGGRRAALEAVAEDPTSADAVAAASWWLSQLPNLSEPDEILTAADGARDPELGFILAAIESALNGRPPAGTLTPGELVGPFGVFDILDLERGTAPPDAELPPPDTGFSEPWRPVRFTLDPVDGVISPPDVLAPHGVFVVLWTIVVDRPLDGWLAVEAVGSFNLTIDGRSVGRGRMSGRVDPELVWFRVRLDAGRHRIRAEMSSRGRPEVRAGLFDLDGRPATTEVVTGVDAGPWASSEAAAQDPPATAARLAGIDAASRVDDLLLTAAIAEHRRDTGRWRRAVERAVELAPDDPWTHLAVAWYWLAAPTIQDAEVVRRRIRDELHDAADIPIATHFKRALAERERREEDSDRLLEEMVAGHGRDVRVLKLWILEALDRGWVREADDGLQRLRARLPGSRTTAEVELQVLEALERWQERQQRLHALAAEEPVDFDVITELADGCLVDDAIAVVERLRRRAVDPDLDIELVRLLLAAGETDAAAAQLDALRRRWGDVRLADQLALAATADDPVAGARTLDEVLGRAPSSLELLSLAWRRGRSAFFEPYRLTVDEVLAGAGAGSEDVDAELLLDQAVERVFDDGSSLYYYHGVTRALTPVGAGQAAQLQQLPNAYRLAVRIHKPDGTIDVPAAIGASGGAVELEGVEPGDLVEEEYVARIAPTGASQRGHLPPYIYRFADSQRAFGLSEYLLLVPPDIELLIEGNFDGVERTEWTVDGLRAIRWRAEEVPPISEERFAPPTSELLPWVSYGFGVTWQDVGDALRDRLRLNLVMTPELDRWSEPLLDADRPELAVKQLMNGLIDEVEPGRGVIDFSSFAGESFSRRRGNRLGIVAAVLLAADWQVDLVMSRTRPFAGTHLLVPTFDSFILPVLRVRHDGQEIWIDVEEERRGVNRLDPMLQGSDGLVVPLDRPNEPVTLLERLPSFANPDLEERIAVDAAVEPSGDGQVTVRLPVRGPQAERLREQIRSVPTDRAALLYQQMAASFVPTALDVDGSVTRVDDGVVLVLDMRATDLCRPEDGALVCRALVFAKPLAPILAALPARRYPLIMPVPVIQTTVLTIDPPAGWTLDRAPRKIETRWGSMVETLEHADGVVTSEVRLELPAQTIAPDQYPEFARFCHAVDELSSRPPVLTSEGGP